MYLVFSQRSIQEVCQVSNDGLQVLLHVFKPDNLHIRMIPVLPGTLNKQPPYWQRRSFNVCWINYLQVVPIVSIVDGGALLELLGEGWEVSLEAHGGIELEVVEVGDAAVLWLPAHKDHLGLVQQLRIQQRQGQVGLDGPRRRHGQDFSGGGFDLQRFHRLLQLWWSLGGEERLHLQHRHSGVQILFAAFQINVVSYLPDHLLSTYNILIDFDGKFRCV